jgi:glycerol-3-phosphate acyltransferase PlsY
MSKIIIGIIVSYIIGAIPFSYILGKLFKGIDIREYGSGNVGATNLIRSVGKLPGLIALLLDALKGFIVVIFAAGFFYRPAALPSLPLFKCMLGLAVVFGHIWTVFLKFRGGKGVATAIGVFIGLAPLAMAFGLCIWGLSALIFRYVSLSSIIMAISLPVIMFILNKPNEYILFACLLGAFIIYRHRANISRIINGTEYKIGQRL